MLKRNKLRHESPPGSALSSNSSLSEDMEISKQRRRNDAIIKARKRNMVAKMLLHDEIQRINQNHKLQFKQLTKEKRLLEEELDKTASSNAGVSHLPTLTSSISLTTAPSQASISAEPPCSNCLFGTTKTFRCQNFPCCLPPTYHTIGGRNLPISYSGRLSNYRELQRRSRDIRPPTSHSNRRASAFDNDENCIRSTRKSVEDKLRGLRYLMREMRESHEKQKPVNWSTNYGAPFPKRLLLKPVVPT